MSWQRISCFTLLLFAFPILSEEPRPATLEQIQKALDWNEGKIITKSPFKVGDVVEIEFELKNTTSEEFKRPPQKGSSPLLIGDNQAWCERIDSDSKSSSSGSKKEPVKRNTKLAAGGTQMDWPETIKPNQVVNKRLVRIDTKDLQPGLYRVKIEYRNTITYKVFKSTTIDFELVANPKK